MDPKFYLLPEATIVTMMDVEVLELCTRTVARMPIIRPATGLPSNALFVNTPPRSWRVHCKYCTIKQLRLGSQWFNKVMYKINPN